MFRLLICAVVCLSTCASDAYGQTWASSLFKETKHDFGVVARAAKTKKIFEFTNTTGSVVEISHARTSCNCTIPTVLTKSVAPGAVGQIECEFNTLAFKGQRGANITVVFSRPSYTEVQLRVDGYIRGDIVFSPGSIEYSGAIAGDPNERIVEVKYAGHADWQIESVETNHPNMKAEVIEARREGIYVDYQLKFTLDDSFPPSFLNHEVKLVTNDANRKHVPLMVNGQIKAPIQVPAILDMGRVTSGEVVVKKVFIKSHREFAILKTGCEGDCLEVEPVDSKQKVQVLTVKLKANEAGQFSDKLTIETDDPSMPTAEISVTGTVIEETDE